MNTQKEHTGKLSATQIKTLSMMKAIETELNKCFETEIKDPYLPRKWFVVEELDGITLKTMDALVEKGYVEYVEIFDNTYYRVLPT